MFKFIFIKRDYLQTCFIKCQTCTYLFPKLFFYSWWQLPTNNCIDKKKMYLQSYFPSLNLVHISFPKYRKANTTQDIIFTNINQICVYSTNTQT